MSLIIAARGTPFEKIVKGHSKQVVSFVGADREGEFSQVGIGILLPDEESATFWGLMIPHAVIQSWRGMKILEKVSRVEEGTLCACWTVAKQNLHDSDKRHLNILAGQLGGDDVLEALRDEVLSSAPTAKELESMITLFRKKGVGVDNWELQAEIKAGRISTSPLIETIARETEGRKEVNRQLEELIKKPLPRNESLAAFFKDLSIDNFITRVGFGSYCTNWGYIKLDQLDEVAIRDSFNEGLTEGHMLEHTTESLGTSSYSDEFISFGIFEQPWFITVDGVKYTFESAKFIDGHFYIRTKFVRGKVPPIYGLHTIRELRELIGPIPVKLSAQQGIFARVASFFR